MSDSSPRSAELFLFAAADQLSLRGAAAAARDRLAARPADWLHLQDPSISAAGAPAVLGIVASDAEALAARLDRAIERLGDDGCRSLRDAAGAYYESNPQGRAGTTAVLFPGEGAPYVGMVGDLFQHFPELEEVRQLADDFSAQAGLAGPTTRFFHSPSDEEEARRLADELKTLDATMCSVLAADWVLHRILELIGLQMHAAGGHSAGEIAALTAAGAISDAKGAAPITAACRSLVEVDGGGEEAGLLALGAKASVAEELIAAVGVGGLEAVPGRRAFVAMRNCPHQTIVVGDAAAVDRVEAEAKSRSVMFERLALGRPYHTPLFREYAGPLQTSFAEMAFHHLQAPVYSCTTGRPFPNDPDQIRQLALDHWSSPVAFSDMISAMYADGVRVFVEAGPRGNLTSFVQDILRGEEVAALAMNSHVRDGWTHLLHFAAQLAAHGVPFQAERLMPGSPKVMSEATAAPAAEGVPASASEPQLIDVAAADDPVMAEYFRVMDQFLDAQQSVMQQFLTASGATPSGEGWELDAIAEPFEVTFIDPQIVAAPPPEAAPAHAPPRPLIGEIVERIPGERIVMRRPARLGRGRLRGRAHRRRT